MRRRPLVVLVCFLLALMVSEGVVRAASESLPDPAPWPSNETEIKSQQMELGRQYSIVFIGTSVTDAAVDPEFLTERLGREVYNAATPFASQASLLYWAERFVVPNTHPDLLVVGFPAWSAEFAVDSDGGSLLSGLQGVNEFRHPANPWLQLAHRSALVHWRTELKSIADLLAPGNRLEETGTWTSRGHQTGYYQRRMDPDALEVRTASTGLDPDFGPLVRLAEVTRSQGIAMVLMPEPTSCDPRGMCLHRDDVEVLLDAYHSLAADLDLSVLDLQVSWPIEWYADGAHFNRDGTVAYSMMVAEALEELGW